MKNVIAGLNYLTSAAQRPYSYVHEPPPGLPWESAEYQLHQMEIEDARTASQRPALHREGFELWDAPSAVRDFLDDEAVKRIYYGEASELALSATKAQRAYVFDHLVRRRERDRAAVSFGRKDSEGRPAVNGRIHNDYTESSGRKRLDLVLNAPRRAEQVKRYAIVNIWRAISGPVLDTPLALCDARSVAAADMVESEVRYPRRTGEIYNAIHSPRHRWSYYPEMDRHEALVFKQYDSQTVDIPRFVLHSAFDLPSIPSGAPLRESIELRCLVVFE